jgi:glycosyltransferase involved in cell wall biosynthesis
MCKWGQGVKISVVTVTRNSAASLPAALRSVALQSFSDVEHIVIDGASTDNTSEVMSLDGGHVNRFISEPDLGIYDAMNKGLGLVTGDVVGFLNADDRYADPQVLEHVVEMMEAENLDIVFGDVAFFRGDDTGVIIRRYRSDRFQPSLLSWGWMPAHPAFFMRREIYERIGGFKTDYKIAGDFEMMIRIFQNHNLKFKHIPAVLVLMRIGGVSNAGWKNMCTLNTEVLRACRQNNISTNIFKILSKYPLKLLEYVTNRNVKS